MKISEIMTESPFSCNQQDTLEDAAALMLRTDCGILPIVDSQDRLVGVITDRDIACRAVAMGNELDRLVQDFMSSPVVTIRPDSVLEEGCQLMKDHRVRRLAVVDPQGRCTGIVSQSDIARCGDDYMIAEVLREVSSPAIPSALYLG